jgi:hypothetical protein
MSDLKDFFGLTVVPLGILFGILAATASRRVRALFFFLLVVLSVATQHLDVNFVSREWYRGTTRGFEFSAVDILALSVLFSSLLRPGEGRQRWYWPPGFGFMLVFFGYCCFSVAISNPQLFGLFELSKMVRGLVVFLAAALFIQTERELRLLIVALACTVCWQGMLGLYERYHEGVFRVTGVIGDPNSLSMYLCMTAPLFVAAMNSETSKKLKFVAAVALLFAIVAEVLTISRAGVAAMAVVLFGTTFACLSFKLTARKVATALVAVAVVAAITVKSWHTLKSRYDEASLAEEYHGKGQGRGYYLRLAEAIVRDRLFGVGLNNWSYWVSNEYGPEQGWLFVPYIGTEHWPSDVVPPGRNLDAAQAAPAHNLGALTAGELGLPGLLLFTVVWARWFQMGASFLVRRSPQLTSRMGAGFFFGCLGVFFQSLTEWVYHQTQIFFTFNMILGALASLYWLRRCEVRQPVQASESNWDEAQLGLPEYSFHECDGTVIEPVGGFNHLAPEES